EAPSKTDANGVAAPRSRAARVRGRLSRWTYGDDVAPPSPEELARARRHQQDVRIEQAELEHPASGHELDDHRLRDADRVPLRGGGRPPARKRAAGRAARPPSPRN